MSSITYKAAEKTRDYATQNKQSMNLSEVRMWMILKWSIYNFRRQKTLGNYIVDFSSLKHNLVIEVDGISHEDKKSYDEKREAYIINHGYKILKFVGMMPYPDNQIYDYVWSKISELEKGTVLIMTVMMD